MAWDKLSMADKAKYILLAVRNGVTNLNYIRGTYNKLGDGGDTQGNKTLWAIGNESGDKIMYFNSKLERDDYATQHDLTVDLGTLPEAVLVASRPKYPAPKGIDIYAGQAAPSLSYQRAYDRIGINPISSDTRTDNYRRAMDRNPNFPQNWDMASNIEEGLNIMSAGLPNRLSITLNMGVVKDILQGKNFVESLFGNNGVLPDEFALKHPYWAAGINFMGDLILPGTASTVHSNLSKYRGLQRAYTGGLPGLIKRDVWALDNPLAARYYGDEVRQIFWDPKELRSLETPKTSVPVLWSDLPWRFENGKFYPSEDFAIVSLQYTMKNGSEGTRKIYGRRGMEHIKDPIALLDKNGISRLTTDDIVDISKNSGYNSTKIYNVLDGTAIEGDKLWSVPVNEVILHNGTSYFALPLDKAKRHLLPKFDWTPQPFLQGHSPNYYKLLW